MRGTQSDSKPKHIRNVTSDFHGHFLERVTSFEISEHFAIQFNQPQIK